MSEPSGDRGYAVLLAAFTAVVNLAAVIAAFGVISVFAARDPLSDPGASPMLLPGAVAVSMLVYFALLGVLGARLVRGRPRISIFGGLGVGIVPFLVFVAIVGVMTVSGGAKPLGPAEAIGAQLASPFGISLGVVSVVIALGYELVIAARYRDRRTPEWPWQRHEDE